MQKPKIQYFIRAVMRRKHRATQSKVVNKPLQRACREVGGQKPLADKIGTSQSQIWYWLTQSKKGVPGEYVIPIEQASGVPRHELRPDLYPLAVAS